MRDIFKGTEAQTQGFGLKLRVGDGKGGQGGQGGAGGRAGGGRGAGRGERGHKPECRGIWALLEAVNWRCHSLIASAFWF